MDTQLRQSVFPGRADPQYDYRESEANSQSGAECCYYLALHVIPGLLAFLLINVPSVYHFAVEFFGISGQLLQALYLAIFSCVWHLLWPFISLIYWERKTTREALEFLGLARFDAKGFFVVVPLFFMLFVTLTLPYVLYLYIPIQGWLSSFPVLQMPDYSIFKEGRIFSLPAAMLIFLALGNYLGEEVYYRGYLLKKIGFLGPWAWVFNSVLFGFYHVWQAPETWPLIPSALFFGLLMQYRKNLYPLLLFHVLVNLALGPMIGAAYSIQVAPPRT